MLFVSGNARAPRSVGVKGEREGELSLGEQAGGWGNCRGGTLWLGPKEKKGFATLKECSFLKEGKEDALTHTHTDAEEHRVGGERGNEGCVLMCPLRTLLLLPLLQVLGGRCWACGERLRRRRVHAVLLLGWLGRGASCPPRLPSVRSVIG